MILLWTVLGCLPGRDNAPSTTATQRTTAAASPPAAEASFWDLSHDTGWMEDYPVVDCPWPDEDDLVIQVVTYDAVMDFLDDGLIFDMHGYSFGDGDCSQRSELTDAFYDGTVGLMFDITYMDVDFTPDSAPGLIAEPNTFTGLGYALSAWMLYSNGSLTSGYPSTVLPVYNYDGEDPYSDFCLVRVRPHRIAGMYRVEAPPYHLQEHDWPEELWNGVYVWWDIRWGEHINQGSGLSCMHVFYEGDADPNDVWPEMPLGWTVEDSL